MQAQFGWDNATKGLVLSTFFIGYMLGQIPGGWVATHFGGQRVFGGGVLATAVLTLLVPLCTTGNLLGTGKASHLGALYALRIAMGLFESVTFPALFALLRMWTPFRERSTIVSVTFAGAMLGTVVAFPACGWIIDMKGGKGGKGGKDGKDGTDWSGNAPGGGGNTEGSWVWVFYSFGAFGVLWFICWCLLIRSAPEFTSCISTEEKAYIIATRGVARQLTSKERAAKKEAAAEGERSSSTHTAKKGAALKSSCSSRVRLFWGGAKGFVTEPAAWAIYTAHFASNWSLYTFLTWLPSYMKDQLHFDLSKAGLLSILPFLAQCVLGLVGGRIADLLVTRKCISLRGARILATVISYEVPAGMLCAVGFATTPATAIALMTAAVGIAGLNYSGYSANVLDIAPKNAGIFYGVSNTIATIPG